VREENEGFEGISSSRPPITTMSPFGRYTDLEKARKGVGTWQSTDCQ